MYRALVKRTAGGLSCVTLGDRHNLG